MSLFVVTGLLFGVVRLWSTIVKNTREDIWGVKESTKIEPECPFR